MQIIVKKGPTDQRKGIKIIRQKRVKLTKEGFSGQAGLGEKKIKILSNSDRRRLNLNQDPDLDDYDKNYNKMEGR